MTPGERFPKKEHLVKTKDFKKVYLEGRAFRNEAIVLYALPNPLEFNRIGFSVGSRAVKLATGRNRIKRLFREAYRRNKKLIKSGSDMVVVVKKDISGKLTYQNAEEMLLRVLKKSGMMIT